VSRRGSTQELSLPPSRDTRLPARTPASGAEAALGWLRRAFEAPIAGIEREVRARLAKAPLQLNEFGFDRYGLRLDDAARVYVLSALLYRNWFRVETHGIERVPSGRVLLIANHSGQFGYDGTMLATAMLLEAELPRLARGMADYFFWRMPWLGELATQMGSVVGTPENCTALLAAGECLLVFPEGARGANKPFHKRYQLQHFGHGFMRLALATDTPIVPVGIVGAEEQQPGLANWERLGHALGLPSFPITISMPWFGPLGVPFALPVKYHLHFGEPLHFSGREDEEDDAIAAKVAQVKQAIAELLAEGLRSRRGIFR
jgi:1-acyl-sn-glycerol-3-phosphate acyltransferase